MDRRQKIIGWTLLAAILVLSCAIELAQTKQDGSVAEMPVPKS